MKVMTIVGTRPEIIKLSRVIAALDRHTDHVLVHTGQNFDWELNEIFFKELEIRKPNYFLNAAGASPIETIARVLLESDKVLEKEAPDAVLVYGDTNSCLSIIAAKKRKIPIFHLEAGNRCFDQRVPEEVNRKIVDHLSDINMPLSEHARQYLQREGIAAERIIKIGSCMKEVLSFYLPKIDARPILETLKTTPKEYILVSLHREENVDFTQNLHDIVKSLELLNQTFKKRIFVSTHPRTRDRLAAGGFSNSNPEIEYVKPFGFLDYVKLQKHAFCVVSDSGTITEEASLLQIPAVTIRNTHERPEGMDQGTVILSGTNPSDVAAAVKLATETRPGKLIPDYDVDGVSEQVVKIVQSYKHYVDRFVWRKMV